jgi:signal transduction histidine kinase/DNA-binding response OmpR family regulator
MANDHKVDILVVDDLPEKLLVYETILRCLGQNVIAAHSGREALRFLLEREFAVILLDVNMPEMDGFETAAMIRGRRQSADTPIIFVTAFFDEMHSAQGYSLGAVDYILTPIVPEILCTKVRVFVDLFKKTQQVKRQAEEHIALVRAETAREATEQTNRRLAFLTEASTILVQSLEYDARIRELANLTIPFLGDFCAITLLGEHDPDDWRTELAWIDGPRGSRHEDFARGAHALPTLANLIKCVVATGQAEVFVDPGHQASADDDRLAASDLDAGAGQFPRVQLERTVVVPLRARGRILGTILLGQYSARTSLASDDLALAIDLAGRAAVAIDNARLYRDVQENNRRKNEFLAMLAHELRNPLAPIKSAVEILQALRLEDETVQWANEVISRQLEQMVRLVDDLLDISRITGGKIQLRREPINAATAVARAVETSRPLLEARKHSLSVTFPPQPVWVDADAVRLSQVLGNLLNNAAKYTEEGGSISLDIASVGAEAVFSVRDNGIGIPAEKISSIFDLFTQVDNSLDRSNGGLGIGLTLVRRMVELHGGTVSAASEGPGRGSEFVIRMPSITPVLDGDAGNRALANEIDAAHQRPTRVGDH